MMGMVGAPPEKGGSSPIVDVTAWRWRTRLPIFLPKGQTRDFGIRVLAVPKGDNEALNC